MGENLTFYNNPVSRGRIVRWMLEEVGTPYETKLVEYGPSMKTPEYLRINPMGKVPAIVHGDQVVTECAAICAYLADAFQDAGLAPPLERRSDYYRWLFFTAGPMEAAAMERSLGYTVPDEKRGMLGYGSFELARDALLTALEGKTYIAGDQFSAADVYVGSNIFWYMDSGMLERDPVFEAYWAGLSERPAWHRATELDVAMMPQASRDGVPEV